MSIEKMSQVHIVGDIEKLDLALLKCCESGLFHIENPHIQNKENEEYFKSVEGINPYSDNYNLTLDVMSLMELKPKFKEYSNLKLDSNQIKEYLSNKKNEVLEISNKIVALNDEKIVYEQALNQVEHLKGLDVEIREILSSEVMVTRFGRLPVDSFAKLEYFSKYNFFFFDFDHDEDYYWGIYFTPNTHVREIDHIFNTLYFEIIDIPDFARGTPELAIKSINVKISDIIKNIKELEDKRNELLEENKDQILMLYSLLKTKNDTFGYRKFVKQVYGQFYIEGFVPTKRFDEFASLFDEHSNIICEENPVEEIEDIEPPVQLKTNWFFKPFEMFVKMYGLPNYYDINPTSFIGFIYVLLFGIMFGDLGQGLVICLLGIFLWKKKKMQLGAIMSRLGISSMVFGVAYGSVFGYEHLLDPIFKWAGFAQKPIEVFHPETTNMLLISAVAIGVIILLSSIGINIYLGFKRKNIERAVVSNNGLVGLILYGGTILAAVLFLTSGINLFNPVFIILVIVLPMVILMCREPIVDKIKGKKVHLEGGVGGFILQNFFELFEMSLSYVTNTLSFLRIGGFILSHAGMMAVVMTLSEMLDGAGIIVVIIGNIFVMVLEGLLAGIQVLRLVFYETFNRFYEGDGKAFDPVKVEFPEN